MLSGADSLSPSVSDSLQVEREVRYVEKLRDTVIYVEVPVESRMVRVAADSSFLENLSGNLVGPCRCRRYPLPYP